MKQMIHNVFLSNQKGLSLVELLIAVSLLVMVLALGYNFFFFGHTAFFSGESQSIIQSHARNTAAIITKDIRNAVSVEVFDDAAAAGTLAAGERLFYLDGNKIIHSDMNTVLYETEAFIDDLVFALDIINDRQILTFTINTAKDAKTHQLETSVMLNNIRADDATTDNDPDRRAVKYTKP